MKAFIAAVICAAAIGVGGVLCAPYATGDGRRRIFNKRRARRRPRTQSRRDELEPSVIQDKVWRRRSSAGPFGLLAWNIHSRGPLERVS